MQPVKHHVSASTTPGLIFAIFSIFMILRVPQASAQSIAETLQKQVWPGAATWSVAAWENLLPAAAQDTIMYVGRDMAEVIQVDTRGYPVRVMLLERHAGRWKRVQRTLSQFDAAGRLRSVQVQDWEAGNWILKATMTCSVDACGHDQSFEMRSLQDGRWQCDYVWEAQASTHDSVTANQTR
jgi:hypothetical protein